MRKLLQECPACGGEMIVTQQSCTQCETVVMGRFKPTIFSKLSPEDLAFITVFIKNRGNVKEMERELGWSYWTIRNRLNEVIEALGFESRQEAEEDRAEHRREILSQLDSGAIDAQSAAELLAQLKDK